MKHTLFICFLIANIVFAEYQQDIMPVGFEQIHIGMAWHSVVELRPTVEILNVMPNPKTDLKPNPEKPKTGLTEKLTTGIFDRVIYAFEEGVLVAIMFGKEESNSSSQEKENLINKVIIERGMPSQIEIIGKEQDLGIAIWQDQNIQVNVITHIIDIKPKKGVLGLQIMQNKYADKINNIRITNKTEKMLEIEKHRKNALKTEIERIFLINNSNTVK